MAHDSALICRSKALRDTASGDRTRAGILSRQATETHEKELPLLYDHATLGHHLRCQLSGEFDWSFSWVLAIANWVFEDDSHRDQGHPELWIRRIDIKAVPRSEVN